MRLHQLREPGVRLARVEVGAGEVALQRLRAPAAPADRRPRPQLPRPDRPEDPGGRGAISQPCSGASGSEVPRGRRRTPPGREAPDGSDFARALSPALADDAISWRRRPQLRRQVLAHSPRHRGRAHLAPAHLAGQAVERPAPSRSRRRCAPTPAGGSAPHRRRPAASGGSGRGRCGRASCPAPCRSCRRSRAGTPRTPEADQITSRPTPTGAVQLRPAPRPWLHRSR